jgi:hypothetical protein
MKSKNLANVLIKIIGLYVCLCTIPGVISGLITLALHALAPDKLSEPMFRILTYPIGDVVEAGVGVFLITKSRKLAEFWFKGDDE